MLDAAAASGEIRADVSPKDLLYAIAHLCMPVADEGAEYSQRMVALLIDGLRHGGERAVEFEGSSARGIIQCTRRAGRARVLRERQGACDILTRHR